MGKFGGYLQFGKYGPWLKVRNVLQLVLTSLKVFGNPM
jgi:hypothetical protein